MISAVIAASTVRRGDVAEDVERAHVLREPLRAAAASVAPPREQERRCVGHALHAHETRTLHQDGRSWSTRRRARRSSCLDLRIVFAAGTEVAERASALACRARTGGRSWLFA